MMLTSLHRYYQRLADDHRVSPFGYSPEKISYVLVLNPRGELVDVQDIRVTTAKKPVGKAVEVPQPEKKTSGVKPNFLWGKSSYVLGVSAKRGERTRQEHAAFVRSHRELLSNQSDVGLQAVLHFLERWRSDQFVAPQFNEEMLDQNFVFRLDNEMHYLHMRPAAKALRSSMLAGEGASRGTCLVSGEKSTLARLHPPIKGVDGAQSSGASIVSFNLKAFSSYEKNQGDNAPVSEQAAFAYTTALNYLLRRDPHNRQRLALGGTTVVFWAVADSPEQSEAAEMVFGEMFNPPPDDGGETTKLRMVLQAVAQGRPLRELDPKLDEATQLHVLGLSPNASRLSIRFWETGDLGLFARRLAEHFMDLQLSPAPWRTAPSVWRLLAATAPSREGRTNAEDVLSHLAGETLRAILTGGRYPRSLLSSVLMRVRADREVSGVRAALCKAVLTRDRRSGVKGIDEEIPMSLDRETTNPGYRLGRLFAELEKAQREALGRVNATIRDRYFGAASATPATVFAILLRNAQHHVSKLKKNKPWLAPKIEKEIDGIVDGFGSRLPRNLRLEDQGRFVIGYYHQSHASSDENNDNSNETEALETDAEERQE